MKEVTFHDWVFLVDYEKTVEAYEKATMGGSSECPCGVCRNFLRFQDRIYPKEIIKLFKELGIDYKKDEDVVNNYTNNGGLLEMMIYFNFYGKIKVKGSNKITIHNNFDFLGSDTGHSSLFKEKKGVVKLFFETFVEWALEEANT